jgi:hypothetical protein
MRGIFAHGLSLPARLIESTLRDQAKKPCPTESIKMDAAGALIPWPTESDT